MHRKSCYTKFTIIVYVDSNVVYHYSKNNSKNITLLKTYTDIFTTVAQTMKNKY